MPLNKEPRTRCWTSAFRSFRVIFFVNLKFSREIEKINEIFRFNDFFPIGTNRGQGFESLRARFSSPTFRRNRVRRLLVPEKVGQSASKGATLFTHTPIFFERSLNIFLGIGAPANRPMLPLPWMLLPPLLLPELEQLLRRDLLTLLVVNLTHLFLLIVSPKKNEQTKHFAVEQKITSSKSTSILGPL